MASGENEFDTTGLELSENCPAFMMNFGLVLRALLILQCLLCHSYQLQKALLENLINFWLQWEGRPHCGIIIEHETMYLILLILRLVSYPNLTYSCAHSTWRWWFLSLPFKDRLKGARWKAGRPGFWNNEPMQEHWECKRVALLWYLGDKMIETWWLLQLGKRRGEKLTL